jgi:hypothetical protein
MGNHDTGETIGEGGQGDALTLYDNLLVTPRFLGARPGRDASITKGLFYRFQYGADVEFLCLDTSKDQLLFGKRMFERDPGRTWMEQAFARPLGSPRWRIPFSHHPPYAAGPQHGDTNSMRDKIIPLCVTHNVRAFLSGHEHNFQCLDSEDPERRVRCFVTGGGGTWREGTPDKATNGFMHAWGGNEGTHFLMVTIDGATMRVEPVAVDGGPLRLASRQGEKVESPVIVTL